MSMFDDFDELYTHMQAEIKYLLNKDHPLPDSRRHSMVVDRVVYFTRKLTTYMQAAGFPATYIPSYKDYNEHQQVVLEEDGIRIIVTVTRSCIYSGLLNTDSTKALFDHLEVTLPLYREMVADIRRRRAVVNYCGRCHYADNRVEHCGLGEALDAGCTHYIAVEVTG